MAVMQRTLAAAKTCLRPVWRLRLTAERLRYAGETILTPQQGNDRIAILISGANAVAKIGETEMGLCRAYLRHKGAPGTHPSYGRYRWRARNIAGIYPDDSATLTEFCRCYLDALSAVDLLAVWFNPGESFVRKRFVPRAVLTEMFGLWPYWNQNPWSATLQGKRVVVVSPFKKSIIGQYAKRRLIWNKAPDVLPDFDLRVVRCPQCSGITDSPEYANWFLALEALKREMAEEPFDVALVGAGAWSLPLTIHAKSLGACGIHTGGDTQFIFGIAGARWIGNPDFDRFVNEHWVRPDATERPAGYLKSENGCYW